MNSSRPPAVDLDPRSAGDDPRRRGRRRAGRALFALRSNDPRARSPDAEPCPYAEQQAGHALIAVAGRCGRRRRALARAADSAWTDLPVARATVTSDGLA